MKTARTLTKALVKSKTLIAVGIALVAGGAAAYGVLSVRSSSVLSTGTKSVVQQKIDEAQLAKPTAGLAAPVTGIVTTPVYAPPAIVAPVPTTLAKQTQGGAAVVKEWAVKPVVPLNFALVAEGDPKAKIEVARWLNEVLAASWSYTERGKMEKSIKDAICKFIDGLAADSQMVYGCDFGSTATAKLGTRSPTATIVSTAMDIPGWWRTGILRVSIKYRVSLNAANSSIGARVKCRGPVLRRDGVCPDPNIYISRISFAQNEGELELSMDTKTGKSAMIPKSYGEMVTGMNMNLCFHIAVFGKKCWPIHEYVVPIITPQFEEMYKTALQCAMPPTNLPQDVKDKCDKFAKLMGGVAK